MIHKHECFQTGKFYSMHAFIFIATKLFLILCHKRHHSFFFIKLFMYFYILTTTPPPSFPPVPSPCFPSTPTPNPLLLWRDITLIVDFSVSLFICCFIFHLWFSWSYTYSILSCMGYTLHSKLRTLLSYHRSGSY